VSLWRLIEIRITPDVLFYIGPLPVTNTLLCTWLVIIGLILFFYFGTRRRDMVPRGMQNLVEWIIEQIQGLVYGVSGKDKGKKFFPLVATFFIFILAANLIDILPGVDTIGSIDLTKLHEAHTSAQPILGFLLVGDLSNAFVPWFRPPTSDLNLNFAMSLTAVITAWAFGFVTLGPAEFFNKYLSFGTLIRSVRKFDALGIFQGFIEVFVGLLELLDEVTRILSLAFRLFGNIFAGAAVLAVFAFILPFAAAIAFIPLELFVGFVQALVFSLLTLVYLEIATTSHRGHDETAHDAESDLKRTTQEESERQEAKEAAAAL
jgi:F-type H+-transporting ATPase subunit a